LAATRKELLPAAGFKDVARGGQAAIIDIVSEKTQKFQAVSIFLVTEH
jgi:hypothetical protein